MKDIHVEVAILGLGSAGLNARKQVAKVTDDYILIQGGPFGTTCARVGCMPSKLLIQAAHDFYRRKYLGEFGINGAEHLELNIEKVMHRVRSYRDQFAKKMSKITEAFASKIYQGYAKLIAPNIVDVDGQIIKAKKIIISVGSRPNIPTVWENLRSVLTTDMIFEQSQFPKNWGVVGAGAIGLELGQAFSRLGLKTTILEALGTLGFLTDPVVNRYGIELFSQELDLQLNKKADLFQEGKGEQIHLLGKQDSLLVKDRVLVAIGRRSNIDRLGLDSLGIPLQKNTFPFFDPHTMKVDGYPIYLAGDASGYRPILHEAIDEGNIAGYNAVHCLTSFDRRVPLLIAFCDPQMARVGKSYEQVQEIEHVVGEFVFHEQGRAKIMAENKGICRVYVHKYRGDILGAEMLMPRGEHIAHLLSWLIQKKTTVFESLELPFYHPVLEEGVREALRDAAGKCQAKSSMLEMRGISDHYFN